MRINSSSSHLLLRAGLAQGAICALLLLSPHAAVASGGANVSTAPQVSYGQQEFGNTATDHGEQTENHCLYLGETGNSWWNLPVNAGDRVTIDFESDPSIDVGLAVFAVGTSDFQVGTVGESHYATPDGNGKAQSIFTATVTGTMPMDFFECDTPGPYDFTVQIQHDVRLGLPALTSLPLTGSVSVGVHNPDGVALTDPALIVYLQVKPKGGDWATIGSAPASAGVATISYAAASTMAGQKVSLRAVSAGPGYLTDSTSSEKVLVGAAPLPPTKRVHHRHEHHHHKRHRHHHHHRR